MYGFPLTLAGIPFTSLAGRENNRPNRMNFPNRAHLRRTVMVSALRIRGAEVPCVKEGKAEDLDSNRLRQPRTRVQRQAGCVQFVQKCISSGNEWRCLRNLDNHTITVHGPTNFTELKMKVAIIRLDVDCPEVALEGPY